MLGQIMEKSIVIFIPNNQIICKGQYTNFFLMNVNAAIKLQQDKPFSLSFLNQNSRCSYFLSRKD